MISYLYLPIPGSGSQAKRKIYVYQPPSEYGPFPVLYMMDGHNVFFDQDATYGKSWGMKEAIEGMELPLMIVAVDCDHSPRNGRLREYSPFTFRDPGLGTIRGRGQTYMDWMAHTLKPIIDSTYDTIPSREFTFIAGSSMGGLMALYALCRHGDTFSGAAALSPSLWTSPRSVHSMICSSPYLKGSRLYMDYGEKELQHHQAMLSIFTRSVADAMAAGAMVCAQIVPGGEHCEACWERQVPAFLTYLLDDPFES